VVVYIVTKNGVVDEVFLDRPLAEAHVKYLTSLWAMAKIIEKTVKES
jgi:hypothetical protein